MQTVIILKKLGLSDKAISVYLTLLKLGPSPVRKIAQAAKVNRGTTYDLLKNLRELNLVDYYHQRRHQYFVAEDPEKLEEFASNQEIEFTKAKRELNQLIPHLRSLYDKTGYKALAKYYEGFGGIKIILEDVLKTMQNCANKEYLVYSSANIRDYLYKTFPNFTAKRIKKGIFVRVIALGQGGDPQPLAERKWLTKSQSAPTYIIIYGGKTAFISLDQTQTPVGVIIEDKNLFETQKILFEDLWQKI